MTRRLTLIAGSGLLAPLVADGARNHCDALQVIDIVGRGDVAGDETKVIPLARADELLNAIKQFGTTHLLLAGAVQISDSERQGLAKAFGMTGGKAHSIGDVGFTGLIPLYASMSGIELVGAHEILPELLTPVGIVAGSPLDAGATAFALAALRAARAVGQIDLGQAVVLSGDRPIAAEDAGGTDALLARVAELRRMGLIGDTTLPLILAKALKPEQPRFVDLPTIGPQTVTNAAAAGISVIAMEAGHSLLLDRRALETEAGARGITVVGLRHG